MQKRLALMKYRLIYIFAYLISRAPFRLVRIVLYRLVFRYDISFQANIKFGNIIAVDKAKIGKCELGVFNCFRGPCTVEIQDGTIFGKCNEFRCPEWVLDEARLKQNYARYLKVGKDCVFGHFHFFDLAGGVSLGDRNWIAGRYSQFWSHGVGERDREIIIGNDNYIGSGVRFIPGSSIANKTIIIVGSVIGRKFDKDNLMIGSSTARVIQADYDWLEEKSRNEEIAD